ncbi:MAG: zinc ribbon domain-containing protein [Thermodesulfobacteriota bacterium]
MSFNYLKNKYISQILFLIFFVSFLTPSYSQYNAPIEDNYPRVKVRPGDHCTVSGERLGPDDVALLVDGRRVPLKKDAVEIFLNNQQKYFSRLQPKSALFTEDMGKPNSLSMGWFLFGIYILIGLIFAALTSHTAVGKGLKPIPWFFIGLLFNALGYLAVITRKSEATGIIPEGFVKVPLTSAPSICPNCGYENHPSAKNCSSCGTGLNPQTTSEIEKL